MKTKLISLGLIFLIIGCNPTPPDQKATDDTDQKSTSSSDSSVVVESLEAIWAYDYNQKTEEFEVKHIRSVDKATLTGETLEKIINKSWPRVQIKFIRTSNDTAYISIPDSEALTQQMGSAGAESFMTVATFTLTELKGIKYVAFAFEEGDHAMPGVYNRHSWEQK